jgi:iron complex transport system permease protein
MTDSASSPGAYPPRGPVPAGAATTSWARACAAWGVLLVLAALALVLGPLVGSTELDLARAFSLGVAPGEVNVDAAVFWGARFPRAMFGFLAGGALAIAGATYQALLRNDLAEPFTLGVAGGASVGALLALNFLPLHIAFWVSPVLAFAVGGLAVAVIYGLTQMRGPRSAPATLILAGVTMNFLFGAAILLIQYISDPYQTMAIVRWLMGGLDIMSWRVCAAAAVLLVLAGGVLVAQARALNLLALGDMTAHHLGVSVERTRVIALLASSLLAAFVVAYAGPVGFVGLMVPHVLRRVVGADHRVLLPATVLAGGSFLVVCDAGARALLAPGELPVGILTAFLGAPFFLWLLFRKG